MSHLLSASSKILAVNEHADEAGRAQLVQRNCPLLPASSQELHGVAGGSSVGDAKQPTVKDSNDKH